MRKILLLAAALLMGCASAGTNYDPAVVQTLSVGMPEAEVVRRLGQPNNITILPDGTRQLLWMHATGNALGQGRSKAVILRFDQQGRYTGLVSSSQTRIN